MPPPYICGTCGRVFDKPVRLERHMTSHTGARPFACTYPGCTKEFSRKDHLTRHYTGAHTDDRRWRCTHPGCSTSFYEPSHLHRHLRTHRVQDVAAILEGTIPFPSGIVFCPLCVDEVASLPGASDAASVPQEASAVSFRKLATLQGHFAAAHADVPMDALREVYHRQMLSAIPTMTAPAAAALDGGADAASASAGAAAQVAAGGAKSKAGTSKAGASKAGASKAKLPKKRGRPPKPKPKASAAAAGAGGGDGTRDQVWARAMQLASRMVSQGAGALGADGSLASPMRFLGAAAAAMVSGQSSAAGTVAPSPQASPPARSPIVSVGGTGSHMPSPFVMAPVTGSHLTAEQLQAAHANLTTTMLQILGRIPSQQNSPAPVAGHVPPVPAAAAAPAAAVDAASSSSSSGTGARGVLAQLPLAAALPAAGLGFYSVPPDSYNNHDNNYTAAAGSGIASSSSSSVPAVGQLTGKRPRQESLSGLHPALPTAAAAGALAGHYGPPTGVAATEASMSESLSLPSLWGEAAAGGSAAARRLPRAGGLAADLPPGVGFRGLSPDDLDGLSGPHDFHPVEERGWADMAGLPKRPRL